MTLHDVLALPVVRGVLSGWLAAAAVDYRAFVAWRSFHDVASYQWNTALFRWCQGAVIGGLTAVGYGAIV